MLSVAFALVFARVFGYLLDYIKQPPVIGEILAGFILGGFGLGYLAGRELSLFSFTFSLPNISYTSESFTFFAQLGILFLMFLSGLEISLSDFKKVQKPSILSAVGGVLVPLLFGLLACYMFGYSLNTGLYLGLIMVCTSVGVPVRVLMDLHMLNTEVGLTILGAAVIDDIIGIILFTLTLGLTTLLDVAFLGLKILIFLTVSIVIGLKIIDTVFDLGEKIHLPKALLSIALSIFLLYSFFAYQAGIAGITGAFIAGVVVSHAIKSKKIVEDIKTISYGLFIPLFFVWVGANIDPTIFIEINIIGFAIVVILLGIAGKIIGCGLGGRLAGMSGINSLRLGIGMVPRLEMALIIAGAEISHGLFSEGIRSQMLTITVLLTIVTTLVTPFLLRVTFTFKNKKSFKIP
ncbi:MAG: cation:proton antiporter [Candidatus Thermoplasmatota archaeon]